MLADIISCTAFRLYLWGALRVPAPLMVSRKISVKIIATAKTVRTLLMAETIDFIASSFFLLPTDIGLLL